MARMVCLTCCSTHLSARLAVGAGRGLAQLVLAVSESALGSILASSGLHELATQAGLLHDLDRGAVTLNSTGQEGKSASSQINAASCKFSQAAHFEGPVGRVCCRVLRQWLLLRRALPLPRPPVRHRGCWPSWQVQPRPAFTQQAQQLVGRALTPNSCVCAEPKACLCHA